MTTAPRTLAEILRERAETRGQRVALGFRRGGEWRSWTFSEYFEEVERAAAGLGALGVATGDHVLVLVVEPEQAATLTLGSWYCGAVPIQVGIPYRLTDPGRFVSELEETARRLRASTLVVSDQFAPAEQHGPLRIVTTADVRKASSERAASPPSDRLHDVALVQLTSGSTGHPRGVVVGHEELLLHMQSMSRALPVARDGTTGVSWLPLHHDMGLIGGLLFPLYNGFPVHLLSPLEFRQRPFAWLEALSEFKAGITPGPPSAYSLAIRMADRAAAAGLDFSALECAMIGAEPISARLIRTFSDAFAPCGFRPEAFFPVYGLAEATVAVTFPPLLGPTRIDRVSRVALEREARASSPRDPDDAVEWVGVGKAIPASELKIVDATGHEVGERIAGEIHVRSRTLFRGYFDDVEASREAVVDGWLKTGDVGYVADGDLFVTGRKKDIIIKGGHNMAPAVVEELVSSVDGVRAGCVAAIGLHVPELETEELWVVAETKLDVAEHRSLSLRIRDTLKARGISVDQIRFVEPGTLPKTTSGKIQRKLIRDEVRASREGSRRDEA